jgi:hypothetical protein
MVSIVAHRAATASIVATTAADSIVARLTMAQIARNTSSILQMKVRT